MKDDVASVTSPLADNMSVLHSLQRGWTETLRTTTLPRPGGPRRHVDPPRQDGDARPTAPHNRPALGHPALDAERRRRDLAATLSAILDEVLRDLADDVEQGHEEHS